LNFRGQELHTKNCKVESKFQKFYGRITAMFYCAGLKNHLRIGIWAECATTVTFLSNII
jgi:hypothetical protein